MVKLRLSDEEHALIDALVTYTGEQKAALMRSLVMERVLEILGDGGEAHKAAFRGKPHSATKRGS